MVHGSEPIFRRDWWLAEASRDLPRSEPLVARFLYLDMRQRPTLQHQIHLRGPRPEARATEMQCFRNPESVTSVAPVASVAIGSAHRITMFSPLMKWFQADASVCRLPVQTKSRANKKAAQIPSYDDAVESFPEAHTRVLSDHVKEVLDPRPLERKQCPGDLKYSGLGSFVVLVVAKSFHTQL